MLSPHEPAGYSWILHQYQLAALPHHHRSSIAPQAGRRVVVEGGLQHESFPIRYRPPATLLGNLEFALKYDGINLEILSALLKSPGGETWAVELGGALQERPTGQNLRRLWFLFEWLSGSRIERSDIEQGNYLPLLDPESYYTATPRSSRRHRVLDNLLGGPSFCPILRRTPKLADFEQRRLSEAAAEVVRGFDEDVIRRAVHYLYTKETRASFAIENESPSLSRVERFMLLLQRAPRIEHLDREQLLELQNDTVDPRFRDTDYRSLQVYVGESVGLRQRVDFVAPKPEDVPGLMEGWLESLRRTEGAEIDPVALAAALSFSFVLIHPFQDGNGRLHRFLIHYILARRGFTPPGLILPVSAVMVQRHWEYDAALESFSRPLLSLLEYDMDSEGVLTVLGESAHFYRYIDATVLAEALYGWIEETIRTELREELDFLVRFRAARGAIQEIVDMPDQKLNLLISLCLQSGGRLSANKRKSHFWMLTEEEIVQIEAVMRQASGTEEAPGGSEDAPDPGASGGSGG